MTGSLAALFAATLAFVGGHFLLSGRPLRAALLRMAGTGGFRPLYSLLVGAAFVWMLAAYGAAPRLEVWTPAPALAWVPLLVMPFALVLAVAGVTTRSPTAVGGEASLAISSARDPAPGIIAVTRHPFLWGTALWALSHLAANGDAATMILMVGILTLSLGGMAHIDRRREDALGAAWGPVKLTTSALPFAALLEGRARLDWRGLGWWRVILALALYAVLVHAHPWFTGVQALP